MKIQKFAAMAAALLLTASFNTQAEVLNESEIDLALIESANELNPLLPMMVDEDTRWDETVALNRAFLYIYTLIGYNAEDLDPDLFKQALEPNLKEAVCTSPDMAAFVENNINAIYAYRGKDGKQIATVTVHVNEC
ncbi:hypothetical protein [Aliidiomarina haloalkalitolerans]|uniref:Uncharacterized protein n=1 Tax=Aliidiomarina haloalkalitolerans TaxID=859059 RepID=A0A432VSA7_9GAMM|nr:hypothetical protein [Aliidiomarina haloalkalitolerans]RUO19243.1 hypothetical protein CWE06_09425 [Aliidiomarina haloalkalitolerans]